MIKKILLILGSLVLLLVVGVGVIAYTTFGVVQPLEEGLAHGRVTQVTDSYVAAYIIDLGDAGVALVDAGADPEAEAIRSALESMGKAAADVSAILLTHGHQDHTGGVGKFSGADVYAHKDEIPLLHGEAAPTGPATRMQPMVKVAEVGHALEDGQTFSLGEVEVTVFHLPGHTDGSAAYLIDGVLFLGDSATAGKNGSLRPAPWIFTNDTAQNQQSLVELAKRLNPDDVQVLMFSHSASFDSLEPLLEYAP